MKAELIERTIDKVADKIGVALETAQPITEEIVRQYQIEHLIYAFIGVLIMLVGLGTAGVLRHMAYITNEQGHHVYDRGDCVVTSIIVAVLCLINGGVTFFYNLGMYLAPLPNLLGL